MTSSPVKIGVVGGIASGKSTVVERLMFHGCGAIHADRIAHRVINREEIIDQIRARWRVDPLGMVQRPDLKEITTNPVLSSCCPPEPRIAVRPSIAKIIFSNEIERKFLESIMWPLIDNQIRESLSIYEWPAIEYVLLDIPLLIEGGWSKLCDTIIFVDCPLATRINNYHRRTGCSTLDEAMNDLTLREAAQLSLDEKRAAAHQIIVNESGGATGLEKFLSVIDAFWEKYSKWINLPHLS